MTSSSSINPLGHTGIDFYQNPPLVKFRRAPTANDFYNTGTQWFDLNTKILYVTTGQGVWNVLSPAISSLATITGNTGGAISPSAGNINIVGSGSVTVSGAGNTLTISSTGGLTWVNNATTSTMITNQGYIVTAGAQVLTLPTTSAVGDGLEIMLNGGTSFQIAQAAGQQIRFSTNQTTSGVGGSITSTQQGNVLHLICTAANTQWQVDASIGNMTVI